MCMLTFLPEGVLPNTERLKNGTVTNRDGHGWAIVVLNDDGQGTHILTGHSMNADAAIEAFRLTREKHPEGPALFHSRYTTHGLTNESNCHPYQVLRDPRTILAHNGVLPFDATEQDLDDKRSDTKYFAEEYGGLLYPLAAQRFPGQNYNLNSKRGRRRLSKWLGRGNKFVVLTVDPTFKKCSYLINGDQGIWEDDGCWYSNTGYLNTPFTYGIRRNRYIGGGWGDDDWDYYGSDSSYGDKVKRWWEDASPGGNVPSLSDALATVVHNGGPTVDKSALTLEPKDVAGLTCDTCESKGTTHVLNYCAACGTCRDCGGDVYEYATDLACVCLWPMGKHPGRERFYDRLFGDLDAPQTPQSEASASVDATPEEATAMVIGPPAPPAPLALPAPPTGGDAGE